MPSSTVDAIAAMAVILFCLSILSAVVGKPRRRNRSWRPRPYPVRRIDPTPGYDPGFADVISRRPAPGQADHAAQLREVETAQFSSRRLLNVGETRVFNALEAACETEALDWRVMAQVSLGEILASPSKSAYLAINSKRVDILLVGSDGYPVAAVEYQGSGHHLGPAATRDAIKKEALRKAGIGYVEVFEDDTADDVRAIVRKLAGRERYPVERPAAA